MYNPDLIGSVIDVSPDGGAQRRHSFVDKLLHRRPNRRIRQVEAQLLDAEQLAGIEHAQKIERGMRNTELVSFSLRADAHTSDLSAQTRTLLHVRENDRLATEVLSDINQVDASLNRAQQLTSRHKDEPRAAEAADIIVEQMLSKLRQRPIR